MCGINPLGVLGGGKVNAGSLALGLVGSKLLKGKNRDAAAQDKAGAPGGSAAGRLYPEADGQ